MADLLIRGASLPKDSPSGYQMLLLWYDGEITDLEGNTIAWAVEVPDHGDLIDRAELERKGADMYQDIWHCGYVEDTIWGFSHEMIESANTIIPASKEGGE